MILELDFVNWYVYKGLVWIVYVQDGNFVEVWKIVYQVMCYNDSFDLYFFLVELYEFEGNSVCVEVE